MIKQHGDSYIEVLVSLLIFSITSLALLSSQLSSMQRLYETRQNQRAHLYLAEFIERARANPQALTTFIQAHNERPTDCQQQYCTATQYAIFERNLWQSAVQKSFVDSAKLCAQVEAHVLHVALQWQESTDCTLVGLDNKVADLHF